MGIKIKKIIFRPCSSRVQKRGWIGTASIRTNWLEINRIGVHQPYKNEPDKIHLTFPGMKVGNIYKRYFNIINPKIKKQILNVIKKEIQEN